MNRLDRVPDVTFHTRVRDESVEGPNPFRWQDVSTDDIFAGKTVVVTGASQGIGRALCLELAPQRPRLRPRSRLSGPLSWGWWRPCLWSGLLPLSLWSPAQ